MKKLLLEGCRSDGRDGQADYAEKQKLNRKTVEAHNRLPFSLSPRGFTLFYHRPYVERAHCLCETGFA